MRTILAQYLVIDLKAFSQQVIIKDKTSFSSNGKYFSRNKKVLNFPKIELQTIMFFLVFF